MNGRKVFVLAKGGYGLVSEEDYKNQAEMVRLFLEDNGITVSLIHNEDGLLSTQDSKNDPYMVILLSTGQMETASKVRQKHQKTIVIVQTALANLEYVKDDGVIVLPKDGSSSYERMVQLAKAG
jgi:riboflavin biosynthesis pyrimidine reductase